LKPEVVNLNRKEKNYFNNHLHEFYFKENNLVPTFKLNQGEVL